MHNQGCLRGQIARLGIILLQGRSVSFLYFPLTICTNHTSMKGTFKLSSQPGAKGLTRLPKAIRGPAMVPQILIALFLWSRQRRSATVPRDAAMLCSGRSEQRPPHHTDDGRLPGRCTEGTYTSAPWFLAKQALPPVLPPVLCDLAPLGSNPFVFGNPRFSACFGGIIPVQSIP